jgi:hypothetical protein
MKKKIFQKLKKFLGCFLLSLTLNVSSIKADEKNIQIQTQTIICRKKPNKKFIQFFKKDLMDSEINKVKGKKIGGILTGTTYEKYKNSTFIWLDEYGKNNKLILSKVKNVNIPPKINSVITTFDEKKNNNDNKIKELFSIKISEIIFNSYYNN